MDPVSEAINFGLRWTIIIIKTIVKLAWVGGTTSGKALADHRQPSSEEILQAQSTAALSGTMAETLTCRECSAINESTDSLCYVCGTDLFEVSIDSTHSDSGLGQAVNNTFNKLLPILGGLVAVALTCVICNACGQYN